MKKTVSVNVEHIDPEFRFLCKPEMTQSEVGTLGVIVLKHKLSKLKNRLLFRGKGVNNGRK